MSENINKKITVSIPEEQKDFLELVIHEDAATNLSGAVQWCVDACMRIEKLYGVDACHVSFNDIRKEKYAIPASESTPNPLSPEIGDGRLFDFDKWVNEKFDERGRYKQTLNEWSYYKCGVVDMYSDLQPINRALQQEITQLKASLEESRNDAKVFQEWYSRGDANVIALTEQLGAAQEERNAYEKILKELFDALDLEGKSVVAPVLDKYKKE